MQHDASPYFSFVDFQLSAPAVPWNVEEFFVQEITGVLKAMNGDEEQDAGTVKLFKVQVSKAVNEGKNLRSICETHSEFLAGIYSAIFKDGCDTKRELRIEPTWNDLLVLWNYDVPEPFRSAGFVAKAFETAIAVFGAADLIAASMTVGELDLTIDEWKQLGFMKIAGTPFAYRDNGYTNPYEVVE